MALNRIDIGTKCTVLSTGEIGIVKQIYFYPTKYELEFSDGKVEHIGSKDLSIEGITQDVPKLKIPDIPKRGIGTSWSTWVPCQVVLILRIFLRPFNWNVSKDFLRELHMGRVSGNL